MTPEREQQLLKNLYDRMWDAITYSPDNKQATFNRDATFVQFSKGEALDPADFANAASPINPGGDLNSAQGFSEMVDIVPALQGDYAPTTKNVSDIYSQMVQGANSDVTTDPGQQKIYDQAFDYLNQKQTIKDFTGNETVQYSPTPIYQAYLNNRLAYTQALSAYRTAYLGYDLSDPTQQRQWQANAPLLQAAIDKTWNTWRSSGAAQVEQALNAMDTTINSAVRAILENARRTVNNASMTSSTGDGTHWFLSYALPGNWADPAAVQNFSQLTLKSSTMNQQSSSRADSFDVGGGWGAGLWSVGGESSGSFESSNYHMDAENVELSFNYAVVRILRPWLDGQIFKMKSWFTDAYGKGGISNGELQGNTGVMPLIPTALIVARDIAVTADFSTEDKSHVSRSVSAKTSVGWGPFKVSGGYSHSSSEDSFHSTFDGGTLKVPGIQVVGWVSEVVPPCPPMASP